MLAGNLVLFASVLAGTSTEKAPSLGFVSTLAAETPAQGRIVVSNLTLMSYTSDMFADDGDTLQLASRFRAVGAVLDVLALGLDVHILTNQHSVRIPPISHTIGDPRLFALGSYAPLDWMNVAGEFGMKLPTVAEGIGIDLLATSPCLQGALSMTAPFGLTGTFNAGLRWDRSEVAFPTALTPLLRYSAQVSNTPWFDLGAAVDYRYQALPFLALVPFVETRFLLPFSGVDTATGASGLVGLGLHTALGKGDPLVVSLALNLAPLRPDHLSTNVPAIAPWALGIGLAYALEPFSSTPEVVATHSPPTPPPPREVIKIERVEVSPPTGRISGRVVDAGTGQPLIDASVEILDTATSPMLVNSTSGAFSSFELPAGRPYKLRIVADGYEIGELAVIVDPGKVRDVRVALPRADREQKGEIRGIITGADGTPIQASIVISGVEQGRFMSDPSDGSFRFQVPVGEHTLAIGAEGHRTQRKKIRIRPGDEIILNVDLAH